ncbi:MAG: alpha/beta hydrolase [Pseudomonadota bacterium]
MATHLADHGPSEVSLCWFEWGPAQAPTLLLVHATGFHARCWDQVVAALPPGYRVVALDQRGHGRSGKVAPYSWDAFAADLVAFAEQLGLHEVIGVGHSMGGQVLTRLAYERPETLSSMVLVDPVIMPPEVYAVPRRHDFATPEEHPIARRRARFERWEAMRDSLRGKGSFDLWDPRVLDDYCRYGVLPASDGDGVELACPGVVEASIYMTNASSRLHEQLGEIDIPVTVLRAPPRDPADQTMDFAKSPTWPALADQFPQGTDRLFADLTHFIPMQDPARVAQVIGPPPRSGTATDR